MNHIQTSKQFFNAKFDSIEKQIPYDRQWENGTGYLNYASVSDEAPVLKEGEEAKAIDTHGRKIIMIGTKFDGNIVLFHRYNSNDSDAIVTNLPGEIEELFPTMSSCLTVEDMTVYLGAPDGRIKNLGLRMINPCS